MKKYIKEIYEDNASYILNEIQNLIEAHKSNETNKLLDETDVMIITYGDSIRGRNTPLNDLNDFLIENLSNLVSSIHILPMFPYSSDDGFSVIDYLKIDENLGTWNDINILSKSYKLMFDAVINHISASSDWFKRYCNDEAEYKDFFIECFDDVDYKDVVRPRDLPLYYDYETKSGTKKLWATFSKDQLDLNYANPRVLIKVLEVLLDYAKNGAKFIRLDAVGFIWKEIGTSCIHLHKTHLLIKLMREVLELSYPNTRLITETNVPHKENISYFGNDDEAHLVYQFPLPPLTLFTLISGDTRKLSNWADSLKETKLSNNNTYFNFLASHDGIGVRPVEGILNKTEQELLINNTIAKGGKINYKKNFDGSTSPYEMNINYFDAVADLEASDEMKVQKFMASQFILLSLKGVPGIYIHSLLGSQNYYRGVEESGINRRINREKLDYHEISQRIYDDESISCKVFSAYKNLLSIRKSNSTFSPSSIQEVLDLGKEVFALVRRNSSGEILCLLNVTDKEIKIDFDYQGTDLITNKEYDKKLKPYQFCWIRKG